jgi:hypothetical protein
MNWPCVPLWLAPCAMVDDPAPDAAPIVDAPPEDASVLDVPADGATADPAPAPGCIADEPVVAEPVPDAVGRSVEPDGVVEV